MVGGLIYCAAHPVGARALYRLCLMLVMFVQLQRFGVQEAVTALTKKVAVKVAMFISLLSYLSFIMLALGCNSGHILPTSSRHSTIFSCFKNKSN